MKTSKRRPPAVDASSEIMTVPQLAEYLVCHYATVLRLLKYAKSAASGWALTGTFRPADVEQWIRNSQMKPEEALYHRRKLPLPRPYELSPPRRWARLSRWTRNSPGTRDRLNDPQSDGNILDWSPIFVPQLWSGESENVRNDRNRRR
jgi:hypothetical protein